MKKIAIIILGFGMLHAAVMIHGQEREMEKVEGPYLGQKPPGFRPQIFAPGIICTEEHEGSSGFSLQGTVFIFQKFKNRKCYTYEMVSRDGKWSPPKLVPFWELLTANGDFVIAPDDQTMFFQVKIQLGSRLVSNIWVVKRTPDGWSLPKPLGPEINTKWDESFASEAANKNLYFFSRRPGGQGKSDLYMSRFVSGKYAEPENMGGTLNTEHHEWDPFIARDESYLIFCSTKPDGFGGDDFYISYRSRDGSWSQPVNMGEKFNSPRSENRPYVTNDGKYFFFTSSKRGNRDIYWVDANALRQYRRKK